MNAQSIKAASQKQFKTVWRTAGKNEALSFTTPPRKGKIKHKNKQNMLPCRPTKRKPGSREFINSKHTIADLERIALIPEMESGQSGRISGRTK